jgi:agmatine deiminase
MGIIVNLPFGGSKETDFQLDISKLTTDTIEMRAPFLPSEWYEQSGVQLTWPHRDTDWKHMLTEVQECFLRIACRIAEREKLLIVSPQTDNARKQLVAGGAKMENVRFLECATNDTWARDHGAITMIDTDGPTLLDFIFNGWGLKYAADLDNQITRNTVNAGLLHGRYENRLGFVLEGGSIECDGRGTLLTTEKCLLSCNRNDEMNKVEIEEYLRSAFHLQRVLWLKHGFLSGDDTDGHVDTLARFCPNDTITYTSCKNKDDAHYEELKQMEEELLEFRTRDGKPYRLLPLPLPAPIMQEGIRLPATYANFLIINGAVLYPTYNQPDFDNEARDVLQTAFAGYNLYGIDCRSLIKQHGSLHCITMQYPKNVLL